MKLWLDDIRACPDGYLHAHSVNEAIKLLEQHDPSPWPHNTRLDILAR